MNNNLKNFLKEKKDLLIFVAVLIVTFIGVISIASLATKDNTDQVGSKPDEQTPIEEEPGPGENPTPETPKGYKFNMPISGDYVITREFFDLEDIETLASAVKSNGTTFVESRGISYSKKDNSVFDVYSVYPGIVKSVSPNSESLEGLSVTIEHENGVTSVYSALSNVIVKTGDKILSNQKIGVAGTSIFDISAGIHVHLELIQDDKYINPKDAIGKQTSELASVVK